MELIGVPDVGVIVWSDDLSVGVQEIDEQHKMLIGYINKLANFDPEGPRNEGVVQTVLSGLFNYTSYHFFAEEQIMETIGYPNYEKHREEHATLTAEVIDYFDRLLSGEPDIQRSLLEFLKAWLIRHIQSTDRALGAYIKRKGHGLI